MRARLPNLSGLAHKNRKKAAPKPSGERADPLKANVRFQQLQMEAFREYGRPMEKFNEFRSRFYPDALQRADQIHGWSQLDAHEARWADFRKRGRAMETFREFVAREH